MPFDDGQEATIREIARQVVEGEVAQARKQLEDQIAEAKSDNDTKIEAARTSMLKAPIWTGIGVLIAIASAVVIDNIGETPYAAGLIHSIIATETALAHRLDPEETKFETAVQKIFAKRPVVVFQGRYIFGEWQIGETPHIACLNADDSDGPGDVAPEACFEPILVRNESFQLPFWARPSYDVVAVVDVTRNRKSATGDLPEISPTLDGISFSILDKAITPRISRRAGGRYFIQLDQELQSLVGDEDKALGEHPDLFTLELNADFEGKSYPADDVTGVTIMIFVNKKEPLAS